MYVRFEKMKADDMDSRALYAKAIGEEVLKFADALDVRRLSASVEGQALELLCRIKEILEDQALEDPGCFRKIEAIVCAYEDVGIPLARHDW